MLFRSENGVRYYAHGVPPSRSSRLLEAQAKAVSDPVLRASVARQMYLMRFQGENVENLSIQQLRGREGIGNDWLFASLKNFKKLVKFGQKVIDFY